MSRHHDAQGWTKHNQRYRAMFAPLLPMPCRRCGRTIEIGDKWDLGHGRGLGEGGDMHDTSGMAPEHARCNRRAGGRAGKRASVRKRRMPGVGW